MVKRNVGNRRLKRVARVLRGFGPNDRSGDFQDFEGLVLRAPAPAKILWSQVQSRRANPSEHKAHRPSFFSSGLPHVLPQDHECHISRILW
jgi:hypothetical protein